MPFIRPDLPYANQSLANDSRFRILTRSLEAPPTDIMLDSEFNAVTDGLNVLEDTIAGIVLGQIPGADDPNNANFVLSTTGAATQFIKISDINIAPQSISGNKLIPASITNIQIGDGTILDNNIANSTITHLKIAANTIRGNNINDNTITALQIADNTITALQIAPLTITAAKIANATITATQLANNAVTTPIILDGSVTTPKLAANAVTAAKMANQTITATQIANATITATQIANDTITFTQINNSFTATKSQQQSASSSSVYVSPARQQDHPSAAKASVLFDGTNGSILVSYGVSNVNRVSAGKYRITFTTPFTFNNYVTSITPEDTSVRLSQVDTSFTSTATQIQIITYSSAFSNSDSSFVSCVFYGTQ
jgi:hypothetical protein